MAGTTKEQGTEQRILRAARKVFIQKGMAGTRMQEVADEAGINKALLHYYFRDKQRLFTGVFKAGASEQFSCIWGSFIHCDTLFSAIEAFVAAYLDRMLEDPLLPLFIVNELNRDARGLSEFIDRGRESRARFLRMVEEARQRGEIIDIQPRELLVNIMALCAHPFIARPMLAHIHGMNNEAFRRMIQERRKTIPEFIIRSIRS
ncbi:MAG: TetR/AcrR family transcriptional regulator [Flavobacteriales bacterium]|nr:TetR/AcrR family transcriptional regulator [Flavobacteriales bacterium]HPF90049.1 helix-turn-helix domain-containing protein [Flavobacteriales bacterium]